MKILVNTPSLKLLGGVANHYEGLRAFWSENVRYNTVGKRSKISGSGKYWLPWDLTKYLFCLIFFRPNIVLLNPSLGATALKRDFIFQNVARFLGFKVAIFIHGFDWNYSKIINKKWVTHNFNKASVIFVLSNAFKTEMQLWGVVSPIILSTTKVDDEMLKGYNVQNKHNNKIKNILFLSRIEKAKGIYETVDTFALLKHKYPDLTLTFVGDGSELTTLKEYVSNKKLQDVRFTGELRGEKLINEYKNADIFFFPSYGEGMPTVVLEAMAFGLPIITRKVGGLCDFFEDGKMGKITDSMNATDYAEMIKPFIENKSLTKKVSLYNHQYAKEHFMASIVAKNIENDLREV